MKKFIKGSLILAGIFILAGVVISLAASTMVGAGTINEVTDQVTGGKVHFNLNPLSDNFGIGVFDSSLNNLGIHMGDVSDRGGYDSEYEIYTGNVERFSPGGQAKDLHIDAGACEMQLLASDDQKFYVEASGIGKLQAYIKKDTLYIRVDAKKENQSGVVKLYIPAEYVFEDTQISFGAGALKVRELMSDDLEMDLGAGTVDIAYLKTQDCEFNVGAGKLEIKNLDTETITVEGGMGDINLVGKITSDASLACGVGNMTLKLAGKETDFNYEVKTAMGTVIIGEQTVSGLSGTHEIDNDADKEMELDCAMGNLKILFQN